jgi:predicted 3-demethylubiquinone-9 3-methyltransferase (glyoxalase superfamily)
MTGATPFLMSQGGKGEAALDFCVEHVPDSRIDRLGVSWQINLE